MVWVGGQLHNWHGIGVGWSKPPKIFKYIKLYRPMIDVDAQKDHTTIGLATLEEWM
jgi:hypothetical protein